MMVSGRGIDPNLLGLNVEARTALSAEASSKAEPLLFTTRAPTG